jgi:steroid delta-isomerase-like uncharacterized protein
MSVEENKAIVRRYIEIGWRKGDMDVVTESVAPNYLRHQPNMMMPVETGKALTTLIGAYRAGVPDLHIEIEHLVAEGDWVVTRVRCTGTHTGDLAGIPPSGRRVDFTASDIFKMAGGRILESWHNVDDYGLLQQVGALPAP